MLQELGKHNCGLRVSGKEKKVEERGWKEREGEGREKSRRQDRAEAERKTDRVAGSEENMAGGWKRATWKEEEGKKAVVAPALGCSPMVALTRLFWRC